MEHTTEAYGRTLGDYLIVEKGYGAQKCSDFPQYLSIAESFVFQHEKNIAPTRFRSPR